MQVKASYSSAKSISVTAALLAGEEWEAAWRDAVALWPPYAACQARVDRRIRVFRLVPRSPAR
ncbi:nitroreductase/quinone reductase family protein [Streptomyces sp. NPDC057412]|uniref:nitroreductase/quinone reductase family protein n=1 Tax=Streptomyces sp. NPDC057412 TaxID=3346123 RepID=UPI0036CF5D13